MAVDPKAKSLICWESPEQRNRIKTWAKRLLFRNESEFVRAAVEEYLSSDGRAG